MLPFRISPVGDQGVLCEFENIIDETINGEVHALAKKIEQSKVKGIVEMLPTYRSLLVFYDQSKTNYIKLEKIFTKLRNVDTRRVEVNKVVHIVPCLYGGELGEDLESMASELGLSVQEIVSIHQSVDYKIYMLGFLPGFVYLGGLDNRIHMPRLDTPRTKIPERSVGIGGNQTGVYPMESPGGWRLIGNTPIDFYDPSRENPVLCKAGEYIRFVEISKNEYRSIREGVVNGTYEPEVIII